MSALLQEAQADKRTVEGELRAVNDALQERANRIGSQLSQLDALTREKAEVRRELEKIYYVIKDLQRSIERYREESAKLEEEKEVLQDRVSELEALIAKRDEEIAEMEGFLGDKERIIQQLEQRLRAMLHQAAKPEPAPPKALPTGDLLDEMIGQYIH